MDVYYFNHINLPFARKSDIISGILKFFATRRDAVQRDKFGKTFIESDSASPSVKEAATKDEWYPEYVDRLFWVCCELRFLQYQYPYPHRGQTYRLTRLGRILSGRSRIVCRIFIICAYAISRAATPIQYFSKVRNFVTLLAAVLVWVSTHRLSGFLVGVSVACGVVSTWVASLLTDWE